MANNGGEKTNPVIYILLILCIAGLALCIIAGVLYYFFVDDSGDSIELCTSDNQCYPGYSCQSGVCSAVQCNSDLDCTGSQECINSTCYVKSCTSDDGCMSGETCYTGKCIPSGATCQSGLDCNRGAIPCNNNICQSCSSDSDCKNGYCQSGSCVNNCNGSCGSGEVCVANKLQTCCIDDGQCGKSCTATGTSSSCNYCVNGTYTCKLGEVFEGCTSDSDCASNKCLKNTAFGDVCSYVNNTSCISNYDSNSNYEGSCTEDAPFCSKGGCMTDPLHAMCDANTPCRSALLNVPNPPSYTDSLPNTYSYYCVGGFCRYNPGKYGETCVTDNDCSLVTNATTGVTSRLQCASGICM